MGALIAGLGALGAPAAVAAPPITFSLATVDLATGAPVTEIASGTDFTYVASVGCPDPSGCGPTELTLDFPQNVEFVQDAFTPPTGATITSVTGDPAVGTRLVLSWDQLGGTAVAFLPAKISGMIDAALNGSTLVTEGVLTAGVEGDLAEEPAQTEFTLLAYERPGLTAEAQSWEQSSVNEGTAGEDATVRSTVTATSGANAPSTLTFRVPGPQSLPGGTLPAAEAFDLAELALTRNPGGAEVAFTLVNGTTQTVTLAAGVLTAAAPADTVSYEVRAFGIEPTGAQAAGTDWSVAVTGTYTLRTAQRSSGEPIVAASANSRQVRITAEVSDTVANGAPGEPAAVTKTTQANITVNALQPEISHGVTWVTDSGESTSVYGSAEGSTMELRAANSGAPVLRQLTLTMPHLNSRYFDYQELSAVPSVRFPAGATSATVQYQYGPDRVPGAAQTFAPGAAGAWIDAPGPEAEAPVPAEDVPALAQVSGIEIVFTAADGSVISGGCGLDEECAAALRLSGTLRDTLLSTGAAIVPPATGNGETVVGAIARVTAQAAAGATITQTTVQATLRLVKPQLTVKLAKRFGDEDGSDQTVYPLTGVAHAGDLYDHEKPVQDFTDHKLRLVASTAEKEGASENFGVTELRISDPEKIPTAAQLGGTPFDAVRLTALSPDPAVCTTGSGDDAVTVPSTTVQRVWTVDSATDPQLVTEQPVGATVDPELIVRIELLVTPAEGAGAFPADVRCASAEGSTVRFRDTRLSDGVTVSPQTIGAAETPGLLAVANVAKLGTGTNGDTATGADSLYLVDLLRAAMYKHYASGASRSGVAGQSPETSFVLSGVPAASDSVRTVLRDTGGAGEAFDVFELTDVRAARLGPDQQLSFTFLDHAGAPIGPVGTVAASTELEEQGGALRQLTDEEISDSQSAGYLAFQRIEREISWDREWDPDERARVGSVEVAVTRADADEPLQRFGAFSATLDVRVRTHHALAPTDPVSGANDGKEYFNTATIRSEDGAGTQSELLHSAVSYSVFETTALYGDAGVTWRAVNHAGNAVDGYLVAQSETPSRVTLEARNKTALGLPAPVKPEDQWEHPGSIGVGVDRLAVSVGGAAPNLTPGDTACVAERDRNPFAINTFTGVHGMTWPTENAVVTKPGEPAPRVAAKIRYTFVAGPDEIVDAPVDAEIADLNPASARWGDVVGVSVEWGETGKYVGVARKTKGTSGTLSLNMTLRDTLRSGFNYEYDAGVPQCLSRANPSDQVSVDGAVQNGAETVDQMAQLRAEFQSSLGELAVPALPAAEQPSATLLVDVEKSTVAVSVAAPPSAFYRDTGQAASATPPPVWTLKVQNTGNLDVSALRMATDSALLEGGRWPDQDPAGYAPAPGTAFDVFDVRGASLRYPAGATGAVVWVRGEDGSWAEATVSGTSLSLEQTGSGPKAWAEVTGFRVQFEGDEATLTRIHRGATGQLLIDTVLRSHLRSAPDELSPATELPEDATQWTSELTAAGVSYIGSFEEPRSQVHGANDSARIEPGRPLPLMKKYTRYDPETNTGSVAVDANPGSWVNFSVVLENRRSATSNLYGFSAVDTLPADLAYNAVNDGARWSAKVFPGGEDITDELTFTVTGDDAQQLRWEAPESRVLIPGQRVVIALPLQVGDGVAAGETLTNTARIIGSGIPGALDPSACAAEDATGAECVSLAYATTLRSDSVRAESYIDAAAGGWSTIDRRGCDPSTIADWAPGTWVRNPCLALTTVGSELTYRLKLINSGNKDLAELRFVDELPKQDDRGTVLDGPRGSAWTPSLVPGSVRLLDGAEAEALGARGDAALGGGGFRYSDTAKPCTLRPDGFTSPNTLACENQPAGAPSPWSATATADSAAIGADLVFDPAAKLQGGEFVIVEFTLRVPKTGPVPDISWNTAAVTARPTTQSLWLPASETPRSGARAQDTSLALSLGLAAGPATDWHLGTSPSEVLLACTVPGRDPEAPVERWVPFGPFAEVGVPLTETLTGLPVGGECWVADVKYDPDPAAASGQYGSAAAGTTGFSFASDPAERITLTHEESEDGPNAIAVTNSFAESSVSLGVAVTGNAASFLPADARFGVDLSCTFAGTTENYGRFALAPGETETVTGLPVGASCVATESDHLGASGVTATVDGDPAELSAQRAVELAAIAPGAHEAIFLNEFTTGGELTVVKTVETPRADTATGDVGFELSCTLGGQSLALGEQGALALTFAPGQKQASGTIAGLPAGSECTVHEREAGGADVAAPDRTVTILPRDEVIVEMTNTFHPAALELQKEVTGPGATEARVPASFDIRASCTRELVIAGAPRTVTDHDALTSVSPGTPAPIRDLPAGSVCAVTEPDPAGAEDTTVASATAGVPDQDPSAAAALVALRGPDTAGESRSTAVLVTNEYAKTEVPGPPGGGLSTTGGNAAPLLGGAAILLLLGAGALLLRRRGQAR